MPKALDLFCGAGGVSEGLRRAGFIVTGVDIHPQPRYRGGIFVQADAIGYPIHEFDFVWASPPCQRYSAMSNCRPGLAEEYPDLIATVRHQLQQSSVPFVIENVPGAPLENPATLCGRMFGLRLYRHRCFESSFPLTTPDHPLHDIPGGRAGHWNPGEIISVCGNCAPMSEARAAMGIDWMIRSELVEAIPPAYAEYIGRQAIQYLNRA